MSISIRQDFLPKGHRNRPGHSMKPKGLMYHTTNNWDPGAGDELHGKYMRNTNRAVSWTVTVDKDSATQHLPYNENGWHGGDGGYGEYNRNWLSLEIACEAVNQGDKLDDATYYNAVDVAAQMMKANDLTNWNQLEPHNIVKGKNCPHTTLFNRDQFKRDVFAKLKQEGKEVVADGFKHVVKKGETLGGIAKKYGVEMTYLAAANGIKNMNLILPGQELKLKEKDNQEKQTEKAFLHTVVPGDTLGGIAELYESNVEYLADLNDIADVNLIRPGQRIKLQGEVQKPDPQQYTFPNIVISRTINNKGPHVGELQRALEAIYFRPGKIDNSYGPKTEDAVLRFQSVYAALEMDGVYGPKTRSYAIKRLKGAI